MEPPFNANFKALTNYMDIKDGAEAAGRVAKSLTKKPLSTTSKLQQNNR